MSPVIEYAVRSASVEFDEFRQQQTKRITELRRIVHLSEGDEKRSERDKVLKTLKAIGLLNEDGTLSSIYYGE